MNTRVQTARNTTSIHRRDFLRAGAAGMMGLSFHDRIATKASGQAPEAKAKSVIQLWMNGGPAHLDTWDPKPEAGAAYCGPLKSPIATNVAGIRISELLPLMARQADKYSIIRSITHCNDGHETGTYIMQTGRTPTAELPYPAMGAVLAYKKGQPTELPPYITLTSALGRFSEAGFLGSHYKTLVTGGDPNAAQFNMQGDAKTAFDLNQEKPELRDRYGRNYFGQCCLMARRLVEHGVPFVTINWGGWDTHANHFDAMKQLMPTLDQALSALLEDLAQRGLLSSTIVVWHGEFGRTPKLDMAEPWFGGRHHWSACHSAVVAGGGFKGGAVVGESDAKGEYVKSRPVFPWDLAASMYKLLGIDPNSRLPHPQGSSIAYVTPQAAGQNESGGMLTEIM
ncbi:MAG: DUF1501 domain-containing protein [Verrucomicrobia bacterium]|nr:DUF1501 domain-containing protein [Verrucomicrobiota bacterium]